MEVLKEKKKFRVFALLEHVVELSNGSLHGYLVGTKFMLGNAELSYKDLFDRQIRDRAESMVIDYVIKSRKEKRLFIRVSREKDIDYLKIEASSNLVVCLSVATKLDSLAKTITSIKRSGMKCAICDYSTIGYELKEFRMGSFDYVFFRDDFYAYAKRNELKKLIDTMKFFKILVGFRNIDSGEKLNQAISLGVDLGHGYLFGSEMVPVGIIEA
ncbi:MAG: diguanylate phosphodiesterase [Aquificaceae bacterium]|nr:diguanylate phosphodiesterase [Aquificaceae bacterium]